MTSIDAGEIAWTAGRWGFGGLRVSLTALVGTRPHSTARCRTPWSIVIVFRMASTPTPSALEVGPEVRDHLRRQLAQLQLADPWQRVPVPQGRVGAQRRALEIRARVDLPPLVDELGQRLAAGVDVRQRARALERPDLRLEGAGVGGPIEGLAALRVRLVPPAHAPHDIRAAVPTSSLALLDHPLANQSAKPLRPLNRARPERFAPRRFSQWRPMSAVSWSRPSVPRSSARGRRAVGGLRVARADGVTTDSSIHASTSVLRMR